MFAILAETIETNELVLIEVALGNPERVAELSARTYFRPLLAGGNHTLEQTGGQLQLARVDHCRGWTGAYKVKTPIARIITAQISPALSTRMGGVPVRQHVILRVSPRVDEMQEQLAALAQQRRQGTTVRVPVFTDELLTFDRARLRPVGGL